MKTMSTVEQNVIMDEKVGLSIKCSKKKIKMEWYSAKVGLLTID